MTVWLQDPVCVGTETQLMDCPGVRVGEVSWGSMDHTNNVQAMCYNAADLGKRNRHKLYICTQVPRYNPGGFYTYSLQ